MGSNSGTGTWVLIVAWFACRCPLDTNLIVLHARAHRLLIPRLHRCIPACLSFLSRGYYILRRGKAQTRVYTNTCQCHASPGPGFANLLLSLSLGDHFGKEKKSMILLNTNPTCLDPRSLRFRCGLILLPPSHMFRSTNTPTSGLPIPFIQKKKKRSRLDFGAYLDTLLLLYSTRA